MSKKSRFLAAVVASALIFAMLFSACFIVAEADHDCSGDDCQICRQISICVDSLKSLCYSILLAVSLAVFARYPAVSMQLFSRKKPARTTLVSLKVKLSD